MFKILNTKFVRSAPVVAAIWLSLTAGIIIEFNRFFPDLLFHPMSWEIENNQVCYNIGYTQPDWFLKLSDDVKYNVHTFHTISKH